jgi:hypothetical protein
MIFSAERLNGHLQSGGIVQVSTYLRSTLYRQKHAGWFYEDSAGMLRVKSGNRSLCLGRPDKPLVDIRLGRETQ